MFRSTKDQHDLYVQHEAVPKVVQIAPKSDAVSTNQPEYVARFSSTNDMVLIQSEATYDRLSALEVTLPQSNHPKILTDSMCSITSSSNCCAWL
jgi:hypothetical protein